MQNNTTNTSIPSGYLSSQYQLNRGIGLIPQPSPNLQLNTDRIGYTQTASQSVFVKDIKPVTVEPNNVPAPINQEVEPVPIRNKVIQEEVSVKSSESSESTINLYYPPWNLCDTKNCCKCKKETKTGTKCEIVIHLLLCILCWFAYIMVCYIIAIFALFYLFILCICECCCPRVYVVEERRPCTIF